jgi:hypothetical protein
MPGLSLYLFHCIDSSIFAMANDQTGRSVRRLNPDNTWLLRAEVARSEVPAAVVVWVDQFGFCLLDEDEIRATRSQWLLRERRGE